MNLSWFCSMITGDPARRRRPFSLSVDESMARLESRTLLNASFPLPANVAGTSTISPSADATVDYTGAWETGNYHYDLVQKGNKVRGSGGFAKKVKGIVDGDNLILKYKIQVTVSSPEGTQKSKTRVTLDVVQTDPDHFSGMATFDNNKSSMIVTQPISGTKV